MQQNNPCRIPSDGWLSCSSVYMSPAGVAKKCVMPRIASCADDAAAVGATSRRVGLRPTGDHERGHKRKGHTEEKGRNTSISKETTFKWDGNNHHKRWKFEGVRECKSSEFGIRYDTRTPKALRHCTLHIAHCTLHIAHCTLHSAYCTWHIAQCTVHIAHGTLHIAHCTVRETYPARFGTRPPDARRRSARRTPR
jgi:hypothetical protein